MSEWKEDTPKGTLLGYKIFVFSIHNFGLRFSYFILLFVACYYFLFSWKSNKFIYYYFRKRLHFSILKSILGIYKSYFYFGQTLIDRVFISSGKKSRFTYEFDGIENIINAQKEGKGALLISAHLGNFEVSEYVFYNLDETFITNIITTATGKESINNYLSHLSIQSRMKFILIQDDMSHIIALKEALSKNEFICMTGDRFMKGSKHINTLFLEEEAQFPAGPSILGSRMGAPVLFVYVMKDSATHYHLYARRAEVIARDEKALFNQYIDNLTEMVKKYPYQWFNYYDFWGNKSNPKT